ncbi:MAG: cell division protein ZapA [Candidatus Acidulodesulfobacterium acidiphilum]|uniref:Cell division protein ZapA n=1 Tax=Candidatus Acidulodesulfobacterium acidiphilum TaxID=2597224 RepID=A0A520XFU8_9DELT|nr:MAG: cell division protein ZapA [Candidatus Acidulodesulfobacterium acidiphilum]
MSELIELKILNRKFILNSDKDRKYLESLAEYINAKADEVVKKTRSVDSFNIAVLTALNIADDFMSNKMETNNESRRVLEKVNNIYKYISKS